MKLLGITFFLFTCSVMAADDDASKKMLRDLEGSYKVVAAEKAGEQSPPGFLDSLDKFVIKGDKLTIEFKSKDGKSEVKSATIAVDASKNPGHITMKPNEGPKKDETIQGIVMIDKDNVKLCWGDGPNTSRPTEFRTSKENKNFMFTLKKVKE